jgi:hypothetical protein
MSRGVSVTISMPWQLEHIFTAAACGVVASVADC